MRHSAAIASPLGASETPTTHVLATHGTARPPGRPRPRPGSTSNVANESVVEPDRERHLEVVLLALPGEQRSEPFATEVEDAEGSWISLANVLDDHKVEALRVGFSRGSDLSSGSGSGVELGEHRPELSCRAG